MKQDWDDGLRFRRRAHAPGFVAGGVIILIGILLLLSNLGLIRIHDVWRLWPLFLIGPGIGKIVGSYGPTGRIWGALLTLVGILFLLDTLHIVHMDPRLIGPSLLIGLGILFLVRGFERARPSRLPFTAATGSAELSSLNEWAVFGGVKRRIDSQGFQGGEILAVFGGVDIDLRRAAIQGEQVVIDANATFGGVEIRVPDNWSVTVRGVGLFGAYEDHTAHPSITAVAERPQRLVVTGYAIFGGVEIRN